jgi:hypothetical protein
MGMSATFSTITVNISVLLSSGFDVPDGLGFIYKIVIIPDGTVDFTLLFRPRNTGKVDFQIPIMVLNLPPDFLNEFI